MATEDGKLSEDARADFDAFVNECSALLDDKVTEYAEQFVMMAHPELNKTLNEIQRKDRAGESIDELEGSPEYELYWAEVSEVVMAVYVRLLNRNRPNIFGRLQHDETAFSRHMARGPDDDNR